MWGFCSGARLGATVANGVSLALGALAGGEQSSALRVVAGTEGIFAVVHGPGISLVWSHSRGSTVALPTVLWHASPMRGVLFSIMALWLAALPALAEAPASLDAPAASSHTAPPPADYSPWRLRLEAASSYEFQREHTHFQPRIQFAWAAAPHASLQFGGGMEGVGLGVRVHGETVGGWELWVDVNAGVIGYSSIEGMLLGFSTGAGASLRVSARFLVGPFVRYAHEIRTKWQDFDYVAAGLQLDFHIDRRAVRRARQ